MPETHPFRLTFSPSPSHLSTARLFTVAIARSFGFSEELVADLRLATSELATLAMSAETGASIIVTIEVGSTSSTLTVEPVPVPTADTPIPFLNPMDVVTAVFPSARIEQDGRVIIDVNEDATREQ